MRFKNGDQVWISDHLTSISGIIEGRVPNTDQYIIRINGKHCECRSSDAIFVYKDECDARISCIIDSLKEIDDNFNKKQQADYRARINTVDDLINFASCRIFDRNAKIVFIEKAKQLLKENN